MAKKTKVRAKKDDRMIGDFNQMSDVDPYDGEVEVGGRRVLTQDGGVAPINKSTQRKELSDKLSHRSRYYPIYVLNGLSEAVDSNYEIPKINLCNQIFDEIKAHIPYHILSTQELDTALRITPRLFSANAVGIWNELGWAEEEFLVDKKNQLALPLALHVAMTKYVADPEKYAKEKMKEIKPLPAYKSKHNVELKKLQRRLMDYYEPSLLADVVDQIMNYKPKKK